MEKLMVKERTKNEIVQEIRFLHKEINFFLSIIRQEYDLQLDHQSVRRLDTFWKEFEGFVVLLRDLEEKMLSEEIQAELEFSSRRPQVANRVVMDLKYRDLLLHIVNQVKITKARFFQYYGE
jgi:hypothetical protein